MKYFLFVFLLTAICIVGIGCEQAKSVQGPQAGDEPVAKKNRRFCSMMNLCCCSMTIHRSKTWNGRKLTTVAASYAM